MHLQLLCAARALVIVTSCVIVAACSGGHGDSGGRSSFSVGGRIIGAQGGVRLTNQTSTGASDTLPDAGDGPFTFATPLSAGVRYSVTVGRSPDGPLCAVMNGVGTIGAADVTNIEVRCTAIAAGTFTLGGTVTGLQSPATLLNNAGTPGVDTLPVNTDGTFVFATALAPGQRYNVTVTSGQTCTVANGSGAIVDKNVANVAITCAPPPFTIGGTIRGLAGTVILQNNAGDDLTVSEVASERAREFVFDHTLADGDLYNVSVKRQPDGQHCELFHGGTGTIDQGPIGNVDVVCMTDLHVRGADVTLAPGANSKFCYFFHIPTTDEAMLQSIRSSAPMIVQDAMIFVSSFDLQTPGTLTDTQCGLISFGVGINPIYLTRQIADGTEHSMMFPVDDGSGSAIGYRLTAQMPAVLQMHFVNTDPPGTPPQTVHVDLDFSIYPQNVPVTGATAVYALSTAIQLPPAPTPDAPTTGSVAHGCPLDLLPTGSLFFDLTMMTQARSVRTFIKDGANVVLEDTGAHSPLRRTLRSPPFLSFSSGTLGYGCDYSNPDGFRVEFGDDPVQDEMCLALAWSIPERPSAPPSTKFCLNDASVF